MKVGFVVNQVASAPGFEDVVSAHVQLPLYTMKLLRDVGHTVQLITTEFDSNRTLPNCLPKDIPLHQVIDGKRRGKGLVMEVGYSSGIRPFSLLKQLYQIKRLVETEKYDILHFYGAHRVACLAGMTSFIGVDIPLVLTINSGSFSEKNWLITRYLWKRISSIITSTDFFKNECMKNGIEAKVIRHGIVRNINECNKVNIDDMPFRILFWRDPSVENGADICLDVYKKLAPKFPDISFDFAVRPHWAPVSGIDELVAEYANVHMYKFPYERGISISKLLSESICVLLPFRELSVHPQFSILESMFFHKAVVTTALGSNFELINHKRNGYLVSVGEINETKEILEDLLIHHKKAFEIGYVAAKDVRAKWNWNEYIHELLNVYKNLL
jgi:glycosyltransferase involved in cell wall biosynthesis